VIGMRRPFAKINLAPAYRALGVQAVAATLLLVATGCTGLVWAEAGEAPNVLGTVVMAGGFCGAAPANMPPCRVPDAPASGLELVFVPKGEAAANASNSANASESASIVDGAGFLAASLKPGTYEVRLAHPNLSLRLDSTSLVVTAGKITQITLRIDAMRP